MFSKNLAIEVQVSPWENFPPPIVRADGPRYSENQRVRESSRTIDAQRLLSHIAAQPRGRTSFKHLARRLGVRGKQYGDLAKGLKDLVSEGRVVEFQRGHYSLPGADSEYIAGRFSLHRDGYGFVTPDRPVSGVEGDVFIPPPCTANAMHHDRVVVRLGRVPEDGRAEGHVHRILNRTQSFVVGLFHFSERGSYVVPHDERIRRDIRITKGLELPAAEQQSERLGDAPKPKVSTPEELDGWMVTAELIRFPTRTQEARGQVVEILGRPGDFGLDVEIIIRKYHLPHRFSPAVSAEAGAIAPGISAAEIERRRDFRDLDIVTIDGETARDFDDAVWIDRLENGNFALQVHIADVSHYVCPGSPLDEEARLRGTSAYFPDRAVPMLPAKLSTGICSLNPNVDRLVVSALLEIDNRGKTVSADFCRGVIRSAGRMTYTNVNLVLEGDLVLEGNNEQCQRYGGLVERFQLMSELEQVLNGRRRERGSIDFDLPEPIIEFDENGMMQGVARAERNIAHRIIEEFMLAANEAVARFLEEKGVPALYRIHEKPDPKRLLEFEQLLTTFGHSLGVDLPVQRFSFSKRRRDGSKGRHTVDVPGGDFDISPRHFQKLIAKLEGKPEERVLTLQMLRSLKQARYSETNDGHFALATPTYTHFTSPIRRYPDLVTHRILTSILDDGPTSPYADPASAGPYQQDELMAIANDSSFTERRAADAERELIDWKKARFMERHLGEEFQAMVVWVMRFGLFVELEEMFVEGLVPVESFTEERFYYRANLQALVAEHGKQQFTVGDRIRVRVDRVNYDEMRPEFSCLSSGRRNQGQRRQSRRS